MKILEKQKALKILKEIIYFFIQLFFSKIIFFSKIYPVGLPFAFIRLMHNGNIFIITSSYFISKLFCFKDIYKLILVAYEIIFISLYYFAKEFLKTKKTLVLVSIFLVLSNILDFYFSISNVNTLITFLINLAMEVLLIIYFDKLFSTFEKKIIFCRYSKYDISIFLIFVLIFSIGLFSYNFILVFLSLIIIDFNLLVTNKIFEIDKYLIFNIFFVMGIVFSSKNLNYLLYSTICSICLSLIKNYNKIIYCMLSILIFFITILISKISLILGVISIFFALILFLIFPNKLIKKIYSVLEQDDFNYINKFSNENRIQLVKDKLLLMSNTLMTMQSNFKFLLVGKIDRLLACKELANDVVSKCCSNCENFKLCYMETLDKKTMIENLIKKAIDYGLITSDDITNGIQSYCTNNNLILTEINKIAKLYLSYENTMKSEDESKLIIANELQNFSNIFFKFSKLIDKFSIVNEKLSKALKDNLLSSMVEIKEVAIFENDTGVKSVNIISTNEQILKKEMLDIIYKVIKNRVKLKDVKHIEFSGLSFATFLPISKIKISFSVSSKSKENKNGDNVVIQKLDNDRYFIAIADGMGHGEKANKISAMVLSLIKSLFEVGFDEDLIIQCVNKLLLPAGLDNFTTLDACVIDLEKELCTFVKLGSSVSILKHKNTSEVISCNSLPIGMIQNINPTIVKKQISIGDSVFIASDGIVDSFGSIDIYKNFINDAKIFDMKKYLDDIIIDASFQNKKHQDDMTIIGINLLKN